MTTHPLNKKPYRRRKPCPVCGQRLGYLLDLEDGQLKLETHNPGPIIRAVCPGSASVVSQK